MPRACAHPLQQVSTSSPETRALARVRARSALTLPPALSLSPHQPFHSSSASTGDSVATTKLRSGSQGGDLFKRANGIPGDPLRENSPPEPFPGPARRRRQPPPRPAGPPRGAGARNMRASERAWRRGTGSCSPAAQPTRPRGLGAPPAWPSVRCAAGRVPQPGVPVARAARGRGGDGGRSTHHSGPSSPAQRAGADGADLELGFHINFFCPVPPFSGPPLLRLLPVFPWFPLAWSLQVSLSSLSSFSSSWSSSSPPPRSLQKERKV